MAPNGGPGLLAGSPGDNDMHIGIYSTRGYGILNLI